MPKDTDELEIDFRPAYLTRRSLLKYLAGFGGLTALIGFKSLVLERVPKFKQKNNLPLVFEKFVNDPLTGNYMWNNAYNLDWVNEYKTLLQGRVVPFSKYQKLHRRLLEEILDKKDFAQSEKLKSEDICRVHTKGHWFDLNFMAYTRLGMLKKETVLPEVIDFVMESIGGTYRASKIALKEGVGMNLSGGFHHAFPDHEEGFCYLNDIAIAIRKLQQERKINKAMIIDCDVHHGNGNAAIFSEDQSTFIFDIYQLNNYPRKKIETDIAIPFNTRKTDVDDKLYLHELAALDGAIQQFKPDILFYLAGADPFKEDLLGGFQLTFDGLMRRDEYVLTKAKELNIPLVITLAGGYAKEIEDTVTIHYNTAKLVKNIFLN